MIDISDYSDAHYAESGEVALAHGYGPLHVNPRRPDFVEGFKRALIEDDMFDTPDLTEARDRLLHEAPADIGPFLSWVEQGRLAEQAQAHG